MDNSVFWMEYRSIASGEHDYFLAARCVFCKGEGRVKLKPKLPVPTVVRCSKCRQWVHRGCLFNHNCSGSARGDS